MHKTNIQRKITNVGSRNETITLKNGEETLKNNL